MLIQQFGGPFPIGTSYGFGIPMVSKDFFQFLSQAEAWSHALPQQSWKLWSGGTQGMCKHDIFFKVIRWANSKVIGSPHEVQGHLEGVPRPGDLLTMVINHLQVMG